MGVDLHGERCREQDDQAEAALDRAADRHGVERRDGEIRHPEHEYDWNGVGCSGDLDAVVDRQHENRDCRPVEAFFAAAK